MLLLLLCLAPSQVNAQTPVGIAVGGDNLTRLLWNNPDGSLSLWKIAADGSVATQNSYGPYTGWSGKSLAAGTDNVSRILWTNTDGTVALWRVDAGGGFTHSEYGPYSGWNGLNTAVGGDNTSRILWSNTNGQMALWSVSADGSFTHMEYGPYTGYTAFRVAAGPNSIPHTLWNKNDGSISLWYSTTDMANFASLDYGPFAGYTPAALAVDSNNAPRIVWNHPSDRTVDLWKVIGNSVTNQTFPDPAGYSPVGLAAGTNGELRLLWGNGQGGALVWTIQADGTYAQTYPVPYPIASSIKVSPSTITAGNTATATVYLSGPAPSGTTVSLFSGSSPVHVPSSVSVAANASFVSFSVTTSPGTNDYTPGTIYAWVPQNNTDVVTTAVAVYTPGGTATGGGGTGGGGTGGGGTGGGGTGGGGTGGGGTGGGGTGGGGTGGGGTGGGGTGGGGTATAGVNAHGYYSVTYDYSDHGSQSPDGASGITTPTSNYDPAYGDYVDSGDVHFGGIHGNGATASSYGTFTAHFTWHGDAAHLNSPPPAQVTVIKRSIASWAAPSYSNVRGNCATGLTQQHTNIANTNNSDSLTEFGSEVKGGATFDVTCSPSASISYAASAQITPVYASAYARVSFTAAAVFMNLGGTTPDAKGIDNILIGQVCTPSLKGIPYDQNGKPSVGTITYAWKASGTRYKSWDVKYTAGVKAVAANPPTPAMPAVPPTSTSMPSISPDTITDSTPTWYWNEAIRGPATKPETITCTATVTPPPGQGAAFPLTIPTQSVVVQVPEWSAKGHGGNMQVNASNPVYGGYGLYAGPKPGAGEVAGMVWRATVDPPPNASLGAGSLILVQTTNPHVTYTTKDASGKVSEYDWSPNDQTWLDTSVPYPWVIVPPNGTYYSTRDSPGIPVSADTATATVNDHFDDYLMYIAPGSTQAQAVPLAHFVWDTKANNVVKPTGGWAAYGAGPAGTVTISTGLPLGATPLPGDPEQLFEEWHEYPTWTQVVDTGYTFYILKTAP